MSLVRTLRILASQRPSTPPRAVAAPARVERRRHAHVPVTWIDPELAHTAAIVHLHGGSYVAGESAQTWEMLEEVARRTGAAGAMLHYRLAPRHPFPAAVEDVLRALDELSTQVLLRPGRWVLSGDEAGAGLALAVAQVLAGSEVDSPAAVLLTSPWADLSREAAEEDELRRTAATLYAGAVPRTEPRLSPVHGELSDLPPVHLVTGQHDALLADSRRLDAALTAAGAAHEYLEVHGGGDQLATRADGPATQQARRFLIAAARTAMGLDEPADAAR
ncbi:esterase/lipase [Brachybacterium faecium DSM 4810]|uniref:Esterase/lipase n=1 Tax=Brachybacterium faecium (strain ATCC 43885 / DSM 4810 / JCM 11609 / LMG 19847 / NBRC 14762 / NCIMB 9860 / 6-10) TaxID=446465 RepID=C7MGK2_BRAFD|nr:alpha/beta hydrolase fold domain-containing protein [Brachybacterium faecium]ACU84193.1 esterase/lipase [Brachybacterium faecium DSM 4810]